MQQRKFCKVTSLCAVSAAGTRAEAKGSLTGWPPGAKGNTAGQKQREDKTGWVGSLTVVTGAPSGGNSWTVPKTPVHSAHLCLHPPSPAPDQELK